ncbi:PTS ascorbate transporter subunit IIC [Candidatus Liberibacter solanacearum]|uniref:Ascorbate-specific PTS system EIIC component n=1 Tax=Candidatus Liberibacter solanacearum TaxID=556287 RepID=A0A1V2N6W8_9HYPH|nr:PTS ascorbate transporter subunit IIC [Candidatus Liberibacter solanacearum]ONI58449.1 PTS ascorbate transporter subunit IIC [Candidatus Liberibacter solanacearum]ONI59009.1 PTS ascorbate transporter subunit IIC [Candidatus Liberibacter solanacearum]
MSFIENFFSFFHHQILTKPSFMLGIIVMLGNILLRKKIIFIISSTIQTIVGFLLLRVGADILVNKSKAIITKISIIHHIDGLIIDPYVFMFSCMESLGEKYSFVGYTVLIAFMLNILMVILRRLTGIRTIILNGEVMFQQAGLIFIFFHIALQTDIWQSVAYSSCLLALYWGITSNILYQPTQEITNNAGFSIGHQQQVASWLAYKIAPYLGNKSENINSLKLSKWLLLFNNYIIATGIVMTLFWGVALLSLGTDVIQEMAGKTHWTLYILETGMLFSVGIFIIMQGVSMFVKELTISFKGISQSLIPGAILAIDCSAIYGFAPNALIWGFLWGAIGQISAIFMMIFFRFSLLIIPGFIPMFFSNATIGIFANHYGGWRAASIICFSMGIIEVLGSVWALKLAKTDSWMGMADWSLLAPFIMQGFQWSRFFIIFILLFAIVYMFHARRQLNHEKRPD